MAMQIHDPQEIRLIEAWRKAVSRNNRDRNDNGLRGGSWNVPFFFLVQAVPIGKRNYKVVCRLVDEPLGNATTRNMDRY